MAGRPTLCTPETIAEVCKWLASGCYVETACNLAGICKDSHYAWLKRAARGEQPFVDYSYAIQRAENQAEARAVALIQKAGEEDPRNLQWWLARRHSKRWADTSKHEVTGAEGGPVQVQSISTLTLLADPEACSLASQLLARLSDHDEKPEEVLATETESADEGATG